MKIVYAGSQQCVPVASAPADHGLESDKCSDPNQPRQTARVQLAELTQNVSEQLQGRDPVHVLM